MGMERKRRRPKTRGAVAVEWIIVCMLIAIVGSKYVVELGRIARCKMAEAPGQPSQCTNADSVKLTVKDDGCIGRVCTGGTSQP